MNLLKQKNGIVIVSVCITILAVMAIVAGISLYTRKHNKATDSNALALATDSDYTGDVKKASKLNGSLSETDENGNIVDTNQEIDFNPDNYTIGSDNTDANNIGNGEAALDETLPMESDDDTDTENSLSDEQKEKAFIDEQNKANAELRENDTDNAGNYIDETYPNSSDLNTSQDNSNNSNQSDDEYANDMLNFMKERDRVQAEMGMREKAGDN